jgi:RNA polymerase sigma-70 factor, ECF subfamily
VDLTEDIEDQSLLGGESDLALMAAISRLAPERRAVIALRYWFDYSVEEIADALSLPLGTVGSRLSRALEQLRLDLEANHVR